MKGSGSRARWGVGAGTAAVVAAHAAAIWFTYSVALAWTGLIVSLRLPLAVFAVQAAVVAMLTAGICFVKTAQRLRERSAATRHDAIQRMVVTLAGAPVTRIKLDPIWMEHPEELARELEAMLSTTKGAARHRLSLLASEIGLTAHWVRESGLPGGERRRLAVRRLGLVEGYTIPDQLLTMFSDPDAAVRIAVYRAMLKTGGDEGVDQVFAAVTGESLLIRALLNNELGKHAMGLCLRALPSAIGRADTEALKRILDMVGAWRRAVTVPGLGELLRSADAGVRRRMLEILPYLTDEPEAEARIQMQLATLAAVLDGLKHQDEDVVVAAAGASGRLALESAIPLLVNGLQDGRHRVARSSAEALAGLGPRGVSVLESEILNSSGPAASAALEALEHARSGPSLRGGV
jgi:HEAT repeat protein